MNTAGGQTIQISEPIDIDDEIDYTLIARYQGEVLLYRQTQSKFFIQSFDNSLKEKWIKPISFKKKDVTIIKIIAQKERFFILYYLHQKGNTVIRAKEFNTEADEISTFDIGNFDTPYYIHPKNIVLSKNKNNFLVYTFTHENFLDVLNFDLVKKEQHWSKKFDFLEVNHYKDFQQILVNNTGETFIVYNQNNIKRKRAKHQFLFYKISSDTSFFFHIPFHGYISYDIKIQYDETNQQLVAAGLYSTENMIANGLFYFNTQLKSIPNIRTTKLEEPFIRNLTGKKKKKLTGIQNFLIGQLILRKDGGALLVAEQRFTYEATGFMTIEETGAQADYLFENILLASIHPSGEIHWKDVLYKSQSSENDHGRYSSFFAFKTNSNIRFLYNNEISWDTSIFEYIVSGKGDIKRNVIMHQEKKDGILAQLSHSIQVSANEFFALSERDRKLRLLKINY
jgi:hypothetical protein